MYSAKFIKPGVRILLHKWSTISIDHITSFVHCNVGNFKFNFVTIFLPRPSREFDKTDYTFIRILHRTPATKTNGQLYFLLVYILLNIWHKSGGRGGVKLQTNKRAETSTLFWNMCAFLIKFKHSDSVKSTPREPWTYGK